MFFLIISPWIFALIIILIIIFIVVAVLLSLRTYRQKVAVGRENLVGRTATVEVPLKPTGVVLVEGERWTATLDTGRAGPGEEVIITKVAGLKLFVTRKE
jgi:membrane protein implicated in regulation of membrane protease activity